MSDLKVHPVADLFPMLADDELKELAADIKQRGLLHPIVLDGPEDDGWLLDGRNRLAACEMAGVEPTFERYDGSDPVGFILAQNINRRHLTQGQKAMLIVAGKGEEFLQENAKSDGLMISGASLSKARIVMRYAPALVDAVISGGEQLNPAYEFARQERAKTEGVDAQLAKLRAEDPELAGRVVEGDLTLKGAWAELGERQRKRVEEQRDARALLSRVVELLAPTNRTDGFVATWAAHLGDIDADLTELIKRAADARAVLDDLIERTSR